jgi:Rrf2 family protein
MAHITRKSDYAVRSVLYLSRSEGRAATINEVAKSMMVPKSFLAKIFQHLAKAGIVVSTRGVKGGFQLTRSPKDISLRDVIEAIQGPYLMNVCAIDGEQCGLSDNCSVHPVWVELNQFIRDRLHNETFDVLAKKT